MSKPAASKPAAAASAAPTEPAEPTEPTASSVPELAQRMSEEAVRLGIELGEVEQLIAQARTEAARHEARRAAISDKLAAMVQAAASSGGPPPDTAELSAQLVLLTKRAALMESQVDVLGGKQRALARYRDGLAGYAEALGGLPETSPPTGKAGAAAAKAADPIGSLPPAVSRLLLAAQEDMRREIARAMHDGPAQSLTNIVLQAEIVEHLVANDPNKASGEARQLVAMVQQTLDATKSFIFDVRPMVLDDLGLLPTLRRAARDRGRRAGVPVEFESMGQDQRLPMDLESGLFRILDEALAAYLDARAERISLLLDWSDRVEATMSASRATAMSSVEPVPDAALSADLPPALAAMMEERRADARDRAESARREAIVSLPASTWREIQSRAVTLGLEVKLSPDGSELRVLADLPAAATGPG